LDLSSPLSSYKAHFTGETPSEKEEINLKVPEPSKKKGKKGSPGLSSLNDGGILENVKGAETSTAKKENSEGMILDRVVEGGLDGVEGMSPSRTSTSTFSGFDYTDNRPNRIRRADIGRRYGLWRNCICTDFPANMNVFKL